MTKISSCLCGSRNIIEGANFGHWKITCAECKRSTGTLRKRRSWDEAKEDWNKMNEREKIKTTLLERSRITDRQAARLAHALAKVECPYRGNERCWDSNNSCEKTEDDCPVCWLAWANGD